VSTALLLPGRGYTPAMPAFFLASIALRDAGLEPVAVEWPGPPGTLVPPDEIRRVVAAAIDEQHPTVVVAKSMGTHGAPVVADHAIDAVWITPLLDNAACRAAIERHPGRQLLVGGSADPLWVDPPVVSGATVVEIPGADHGLCVQGDAVASAEAHVVLTRAVAAFLAS